MHPNLKYFPQSWVCEACRCHKMDRYGPKRCNEEVVQNLSARQRVIAGRVLTKVVEVRNSVISSSGKLAAPPFTRAFNAHQVETRKVKFLSVEDVCAMSSGAKPNSSSQHCSTPQKGSLSSNRCSTHDQKSLAVKPDKCYFKKYARRLKPLPVSDAQMSTAQKEAFNQSQPLHGLRSSFEYSCEFSESEDINTVRVTSVGVERHFRDGAHQSPTNHIGLLAYDVQDKSKTDNIISKLDKLADEVDSILCTNNVCEDKPVHAVLHCDGAKTSEANTSFRCGEEDVSNPSKVNQIGPILLNVQEDNELDKAASKLDKHAGNMEASQLRDVYKKSNADAPTCFSENEASISRISFIEENCPAVCSSWKGSFEILNFPHELFDGLQAYPPQRVSRKAYLASKQMPRVLQVTLRPRHDLWPATFHTHSPSGLDIALYFLPDNVCRIKEKYNSLLELMEKEGLSMQSCLNGVELLIFTSDQLPSETQGVNKQVYLWAVFLSLKRQHSYVSLRYGDDTALPIYKSGEDSASIAHASDDQVVDTNVDMGAKEAERVDKCLRSNFMDVHTCSSNMASHGVSAGAVLSQPVHTGTTGMHLQEVRKDPYEDLDAHLGISRRQRDEASTIASRLHQVKNIHYDHFGAPHGFSGVIKSNTSIDEPIAMSHVSMPPAVNEGDASPGFYEPIKLKQTDSSSKVADVDIDIVGGDMRRNFMPACTGSLDMASQCASVADVLPQPIHNGIAASYLQGITRELPGFSSIHSSHPVQGCSVTKNLNHMKTDYHDDFDATTAFPRKVTMNSPAVGPTDTSYAKMPPVVNKVDAPPGFSELIECKLWDSLSERPPPFLGTHLVREERKPSPTISPFLQNQLSSSSQGSKHVGDKSCFCRICNLNCQGIIPFMQHLAGKKHANHVRDFVRAMRYKEDYEMHGKYCLSSSMQERNLYR